MKKLVLILSLISSIASAARLEDVRILNIESNADSVELKLQRKDGAKNSYFFLEITKDDRDSFEKMNHVIKKLAGKDQYKLGLDIPSFSEFPSGSYYRSDTVTFYGPKDREPNNAGPTKKKKK